MNIPTSSRFSHALLPLSVFALTFAGHYAWFVFSGTPSAVAESGCSSCATACASSAPGFSQYIQTQTYLLGYSFALPLAFAAVAIRQFMEKRSKAAQGAAVGGVSLSAILGFAGCFLTGCCGSPMLAVYVSLLGTAFLPFAKPMVAILTTLFIGALPGGSEGQQPNRTVATHPRIHAARLTLNANRLHEQVITA